MLTIVSALILCACDVSDYFDTVYSTDSLISERGGITEVYKTQEATPKPKETPKPEDLTEAEAEVETKAEPETLAEDEAEVEAKAEPETLTEAEAEVKTKAEPETLTEAEAPVEKVDYRFRSKKLLNQHYEKHGIEMGFASASEYQQAASEVINNPNALSKIEKEDGDFVFYVEATNEFVVLSTDGYIRTYFWPDSGKKYYDKQ